MCCGLDLHECPKKGFSLHYELIFLKNILLLDSNKASPVKSPKKVKVEVYKLSVEQKGLIKGDTANKKLWDEAMESLSLGPVSRASCSVKSLHLLNVWGK